MGYYDPENQSEYINRDNIEDIAYNDAPESGGSIIGSMIGGMAKFMIGMAALKKVGGGAAKGIFRRMSSGNAATQSFARRIAINGGVVGPKNDLRELAKNVGVSNMAKGAIKTFAQSSEGAMGSFSKAVLTANKSARSANKFLQASDMRGSNLMSTMGKHMYKNAGAYAGFYAVDRGLDLLGSEGRERPSWYNVPGTALDFTKSVAEYAVMDGVGAVGKMALGGLRRGAKSALGTLNVDASKSLHRFADKHFARHISTEGNSPHSNMIDKAMKVVSAVQGGRAYAGEGVRRVGESFTKLFSGPGAAASNLVSKDNFKIKNVFRSTHDSLRAEYNATYKSTYRSLSSPSNYGKDMGNFFNDVLLKHQGIGVKVRSGEYGNIETSPNKQGSPFDSSFWKGVNNYMKKTNLKTDKGMGGSILGRTYATVDDAYASNKSSYQQMFNHFRDATVGEDRYLVDQAEKSFYSLKLGSGVLKGKASSGIVDYSMYNPRNVLSSAVKTFDSILTFGVPGSDYQMKPVKILKSLFMQEKKKGAQVYAMGTDEDHYYKGLFRGKISTDLKKTINQDQTTGLAGVFIDGSLFLKKGGTTLSKVEGSTYNLYEATSFSRHAHINKVTASPNVDTREIIKRALDKEQRRKKVPGRGMLEKLFTSGLDFAERRGIGLPPILESVANRAMDKLGIGPARAIVKSQAEIILGINNGKVSGYELSQLGNKIFHMGDDASKDIYFNLADPKLLNKMAHLTKNMQGKNAGKVFTDLSDYLKKGGSDDELMHIVSGNAHAMADADVKNMVNLYQGNNRNLSDKVGGGKRFGSRNLTRKQELIRKTIVTNMNALSEPAADGSAANILNLSKELLNSDALYGATKEVKNDLTMMAMAHDLYAVTGHDLIRPFAVEGSTGGIKKSGLDAIAKTYKQSKNVLTERLAMTNKRGGFGEFMDKSFGNYYDNFDKEFFGKNYQLAIDPFAIHASPYILSEKGNGIMQHASYFFDRMMEIGNFVGLKYGTPERFGNQHFNITVPKSVPLIGSVMGGRKFSPTLGSGMMQAARRVKQVIGASAALQITDTFMDAIPLLNGTMFDEGLYSGAAEVAMKASLAFHKVKDITGVTAASKYMEGLAPGSTTSMPGAFIGGWLGGPVGIPLGMMANRMLDPALPNLDKSYEEQKEILSGRELVGVRRARWWTFGKESYSGGAPKYFRPHWLAKTKSQYKYTDTLYGSKAEALLYAPLPFVGINPIGHFIDKYHYERKHYYDRPYPKTSSAFEDVPFIGSLLGATIGRLPIIGKPSKSMHEEEIAHYYSKKGETGGVFGSEAMSSMPGVGLKEHRLKMESAYNVNSSARVEGRGFVAKPMSPHKAGIVLGQQAYNFTELSGFAGFFSESAMSSLFGDGHPYDSAPRYSTSKEMTSTRRAYWDAQLGDVMFTQEFVRRFVPKEKAVWKKVNPLRNRMSGFLPGSNNFINFLEGDPFTKVPEGEIRLPGQAYGSLYDVKHSFPGAATRLGKTLGDNVKHMVGLDAPMDEDQEDILEIGTSMHRVMQDNLSAANLVVKAEQLVYDARNNIAGYIDVVMRDPSSRGGKRAVEIKTINAKGFAKLAKYGPKDTHVSQINFYIQQLQAGNKGTIIYINRDNPEDVKTFEVNYSERRWRNDLKNLQRAREIAAGKVANGEGFEDGASYSWLDRFRILADVAPYSDQYRTAEKIVKVQLKSGVLSEEEKAQLIKIKKHRQSVMRKYELYPTRFRGRVFNPDSEYELMSSNENIKAGGEYSLAERAVGSMWERFTQMNTPIHTKFFNNRTPLQHYQRTRLYGTESSFWSKPYQDYLRPTAMQAAAVDNPMDGAATLGWMGYFFGGGKIGGGLMAGTAGALYGAARQMIGSDEWVPGKVREQRAIEKTFDELKYRRAKQLYDLTGDDKYLGEAENTMWSIRDKGYQVGMGTALRAMSNFEKPYFKAWQAESNNTERQRILQSVPDDVGILLQNQWRSRDGILDNPVNKRRSMATDNKIARSDFVGYAPGNELRSLKIQTIKKEGLQEHDWGLGWYDQMAEIASSPYSLDPVTVGRGAATIELDGIDPTRLKNALTGALSAMSQGVRVHITALPGGGGANIQLNISRDRTQEIRHMIRGY